MLPWKGLRNLITNENMKLIPKQTFQEGVNIINYCTIILLRWNVLESRDLMLLLFALRDINLIAVKLKLTRMDLK